jgi:hypothetical protein
MTVPRSTLDYTDINPKTQLPFEVDGVTITYEEDVANGTSHVRKAVTILDNRQVELVADAGRVDGQLLLVEPDGFCTVRTTGSMKFPKGTGATFTPGRGVVGDLLVAARGYVRGVDTAVQAEEDAEFGTVADDSDSTTVMVLNP